MLGQRPQAPLSLAKAVAVAVALSELLPEGEARPSKHGVDRDKDGPTFAAIAILCLLFCLCGGGIAWCLYLECRPSWWRVRAILSLCVAAETVSVLLFCRHGMFEGRIVGAIAIINSWGSLDAVLRFPVLHSFDTAFTLKQAALLVAKAVCFIMTLTSFAEHRVKFLGLMMMSLLGFPLMYVLALPLDDASADQACVEKAVVDVDLYVRIFGFLTSPKDRRELCLYCKTRARQSVANVVRGKPLASKAVGKLDPQMQRMLSKSGRDV